MLSPEHVRSRRRGEKLQLVPLRGDERERALSMASRLLDIARERLGQMREEVELAWTEVVPEPKDRRLYEGLVKLVSDACEFATPLDCEPSELRRRVFTRASELRRESPSGHAFDRDAVLAELGTDLGLEGSALERGLYADLKGAQRLEAVTAGLSALRLVDDYEVSQLKAALLRAVRVRLTVRCSQPQGYRRFFHQLKFQRLLYRIERLADGSHKVEVDGPFSLFDSVTKYGLQLASLVPALLECDHVALEAELRWGKARKPLLLEHELCGQPAPGGPQLRPDVEQLLQRLRASESPWRARPCSDVLDLPGAGLCVPDLVFERPNHPPVHLEVLGFWSREAVWRRVELVEGGLGARMVFAASARLRVSEAVLEGHESSALYVYKGTMSPRAVLERVESVGAPPR